MKASRRVPSTHTHAHAHKRCLVEGLPQSPQPLRHLPRQAGTRAGTERGKGLGGQAGTERGKGGEIETGRQAGRQAQRGGRGERLRQAGRQARRHREGEGGGRD